MQRCLRGFQGLGDTYEGLLLHQRLPPFHFKVACECCCLRFKKFVRCVCTHIYRGSMSGSVLAECTLVALIIYASVLVSSFQLHAGSE